MQNNNDCVLKIKRGTIEYFSIVILILLIANSLRNIEWNHLKFINYVNIFLLVYVVLIFIRILIYHNYIKVSGDKIIIYNAMSFAKEFGIHDVAELKISPNIFSSSYFLLKSGKNVRLDALSLRKKDIEKLEEIISGRI